MSNDQIGLLLFVVCSRNRADNASVLHEEEQHTSHIGFFGASASHPVILKVYLEIQIKKMFYCNIFHL